MANKKEINSKKNGSNSILKLSYVSSILAMVLDAILIYIVFSIQSFSALSKNIFIIINLVILLVILAINVLALLQFKVKNSKYSGVLLAVLCILICLTGYGSHLISRVNSSVGNIIVDGTVKESLELSVVVNQGNNKDIVDITDLNGKKVGIVQESLNTEMYTASKAEFDEQKISSDFVEYSDYQDIIFALLKDEIDAGILPKNYDYMFASEDEENDYMEALEAIYTYDREVIVENESVTSVNVAEEPFSVLIIGMDESHSDVVMIATFNPIAFEVTYTSIPRDSLVPICGNAKQKLAHSRNYGRACTIQTVEDLMDIDIDYFFEANFFGVVDMIDAIGGIDIWSTKEFVGQTASYDRGTKTIKIFEGFNFVNGEGALAFARERKAFADGDFQRQMNQQQVITAFLTKLVENRDVNKALAVLEAAGENVKTNIPLDMLVDLFNLVIKKVDNSYEQGFDALRIKSSRLTGYSSQQYDESLELMLYTYTLYKGSIEENRNLILSNLQLDKQKIEPLTDFKFSSNWEYTSPTLFHEWFDEAKVYEPVPDLVGNWTGENISTLKSWAAERGIALNITYIGEGESGFDESLANGTIISQDVSSMRMTSKVKTLSVSVINVLPKVPDFTTMKVSDINQVNWLTDYGFEVSYKYIKSHDSTGKVNEVYVSGKVGQVASQDVAAGTKSDGSFKKVIVSIYDYPYITESLPKATDGIETIKSWANKYLVDSSENIVYGENVMTTDEELDGKVAKVSAVLNDEPFIKSNGKLVVQYYKCSIDIPTFSGKTIAELEAWATQYGVVLVKDESVTTECGVGNPVTVISSSLEGGSTSLKPSELKGKTMHYSACKLSATPTEPTTPEPTPTPEPAPSDTPSGSGTEGE